MRETGVDGTQEYFLNMGPQHPSTHGVLKLVVRLDGETVIEVVPHLGFIHRAIEKMGENETFVQYIHLTDRMDYLSSHINNLCVCMAIEKAMGIGVPERGEYIRVMVSELQRIQSHLLWWGAFGMDLGAVSAFLYGFKEREKITALFEELCGARLTMNYFRPGGSTTDVPEDFLKRVDGHRRGHEVHPGRVRRPAVQQPDHAGADQGRGHPEAGAGHQLRLFRTGGPGLRSGLRPAQAPALFGLRPLPIRRAPREERRLLRPLPGAHGGDAPEPAHPGAGRARPSRRASTAPRRSPATRFRPGSYFAAVETARGMHCTYMVSDNCFKPYRIKSRSPSFSNLSALNEMAAGGKIADLVAILSTLDLIIPDIDR